MFNTLTGRFLLLTVIFVMLAEVLIFVPSVARFRQSYLQERLERAQIASLATAEVDMVTPALEAELLSNAGVYNVVLIRDDTRQLALSSPIPSPIIATYDFRSDSNWDLIRDALTVLGEQGDQVIRIIGAPVNDGGMLIEITLPQGPMRVAMIEYGINILLLSAVISAITAALLFVAVRYLLVKPISKLVGQIQAYAHAPEDARRIIMPSSALRELNEAEVALNMMQSDLTSALKQKDRLAHIGEGVAKVSHDLRNILASAQIFTDSIEMSDDPHVKRMAPKLMGSLTRAVNLCESTLAFGKADEPAPRLSQVELMPIAEDVIEAETRAAGEAEIDIRSEIPAGFTLRADSEQLYRVLQNLVRNARQAISRSGEPGEIVISAHDTLEAWTIMVRDTGPGLPPKALENLFQPFRGGAGKSGAGLGLAICSEIMRGHGGSLTLVESDGEGSAFLMTFPRVAALGDISQRKDAAE